MALTLLMALVLTLSSFNPFNILSIFTIIISFQSYHCCKLYGCLFSNSLSDIWGVKPQKKKKDNTNYKSKLQYKNVLHIHSYHKNIQKKLEKIIGNNSIYWRTAVNNPYYRLFMNNPTFPLFLLVAPFGKRQPANSGYKLVVASVLLISFYLFILFAHLLS